MASPPAPSDFSFYEFMWAPSPSSTAPAAATTQQHKPSKFYNLSPPLIAMMAVIGAALLIVLYARIVSLHLRRLLRRWRRYRRRRRLLFSTDLGGGGFSPPPPDGSSFSLDPSSADYFFSPYGLDESAIKALPLSVFAKSALIGPRDCAVCLLEFEVGDSLRTLPLCSHAFHVDCIDVWLRSHATCPLCRAGVFRATSQAPPPPPLFVPMRAARIRPSLDDLLIFDPPAAASSEEQEIQPEVSSPPPPAEDYRRFLLKRSYSFGFERERMVASASASASTASPWRYRQRGGFWSKRWASPFAGSSSSAASRVFSFRVKYSPFAAAAAGGRRRTAGLFPVSESRVQQGGPSARRSRAMTSPSAIFMRYGAGSSRMRCGDPEALLSPDRLEGGGR